MKKLLLSLILIFMTMFEVYADNTQPQIISVEIVHSPDMNNDQIVDLFDVVKAVKNKIVDYIQEIIQFYGDKD